MGSVPPARRSAPASRKPASPCPRGFWLAATDNVLLWMTTNSVVLARDGDRSAVRLALAFCEGARVSASRRWHSRPWQSQAPEGEAP